MLFIHGEKKTMNLKNVLKALGISHFISLEDMSNAVLGIKPKKTQVMSSKSNERASPAR